MIIKIGVLSYNEAKSLPDIVLRLAESFNGLQDSRLDIVIINNGSTDNTGEVISRLESEYPNVSHLDIPVNKGYGYGVKSGLSSLKGDICGFMWGDNQFDASIVAEMARKFMENPEIKMVKTYRTRRYDGQYRVIISGIYQFIFKVLYGAKVRDINSGPKLFRRDFLSSILPLKSDDWFVDAEIMIKATKILDSNKLIEMPIEFFPRKYGKSNVRFSACFWFLYNLLKFKFIKTL